MAPDRHSHQLSSEDANRLFILSGELLGIANQDGYFVHLSSAWSAVLGYSIDELYTLPMTEWIHPDDQSQTLDALQQAVSSGTVTTFDMRCQTEDGAIVSMTWRTLAYPENDLIYVAAQVIEPPDEPPVEHLALALSALDALTFSINVNGLITRAHIPSQVYSWADQIQEWIGQPYQGILPQPITDVLRDMIDRAIQTAMVQTVKLSFENRNLRGTQSICHVIPHPVDLNNGGVTVVVRRVAVSPNSVDRQREHPAVATDDTQTRSWLYIDTLEEVLQTMTDGMAPALTADYVVLLEVDDEQHAVVHCLVGGPSNLSFERPTYDEVVNGLCGWVMEHDQILHVRQESDKDFETARLNYHRATFGNGESIILPLRTGPKLSGVLVAFKGRGKGTFSLQDIDRAVTLASQTAHTIETVSLLEHVRHGERQYRAFLENAADIFYTTNATGYITYISPVVERHLGFAPHEMLGSNFLEFVAPEGRQQAFQQLRKWRMERIEEVYSEHPLLTKDGRTVWIGQNIRAIVADRKVVGFQAIARDISQRKLIEIDRERLIEQLDSFAETVAHDLKNPLNIIYAYTEILHEIVEDDPDAENYLEKISRSADKMRQIIDEMLKAAQMTSQGEAVQFMPLDMESIVGESLERLSIMIEQYHVDVKLPSQWPVAVGHAPWIEEIWMNYLSNAIKYGGTPPVIELGAEVLAQSYEIKFWVQDNGDGVNESDQRRLFLEYARLSDKEEGGHGLGLSIVKRLVRQLDGSVGIDSTPGQGSRFWFTLPMYSG